MVSGQFDISDQSMWEKKEERERSKIKFPQISQYFLRNLIYLHLVLH